MKKLWFCLLVVAISWTLGISHPKAQSTEPEPLSMEDIQAYETFLHNADYSGYYPNLFIESGTREIKEGSKSAPLKTTVKLNCQSEQGNLVILTMEETPNGRKIVNIHVVQKQEKKGLGQTIREWLGLN